MYFNHLSSTDSLTHRTLEIRCPANSSLIDKSPLDVVYSTKYGPLAICSKTSGDNRNYIELYPEGAIGKDFKEILSLELRDNFTFPTDKTTGMTRPKLRFVRMDTMVDLANDLLMYEEGKNCIYYNSLQKRLVLNPGLFIDYVKIIKSRFLMIEGKHSNGSVSSTYSLLLDLESLSQEDSKIHPLDAFSRCQEQNPIPKTEQETVLPLLMSKCIFVLKDMTYINSFNLPANPSNYFFEYKGAKADNQGSKGSKIDVYLCQKSNAVSCELIIKDWSELATKNAVRFTSNNYFLQISDSYNETNKSINFDFYMSAKRYKAIPRKIFNFSFPYIAEDKNLFSYYFDEVTEIVYVMGKTFARAFRIEPIKLKLNFSEFNGSCTDEQQNLALVVKPKVPPPPENSKWTFFNINIENKNVTINLAYNNVTTLGEYFFMPRLENKVSIRETESKEPIHEMGDSLPMGQWRSLDLADLFRGSFISLKTDTLNSSYQEISNTYLDPYLFKLTMKKPKFFEDMYVIDTEIGEKRKIYTIISTKTDNLIYSGNRFASQNEIYLTESYVMRDFRLMTDFYPINVTHGLVQVQELIYTIKPFDSDNHTEIPSTGVNGVCHNSTLVFHDKLGPLHFCIFESRTFYKRLMVDSRVEPLSMTKEMQDMLKTVNKIRYIKRSDNYMNHIFLIYTLNPELLKDNDQLKEFTLRMSILRIDHKADPRLVLVSTYSLPFEKDFDTLANLFALEIAGSRIIYLRRSNVERGEHSIGVMSLERGKEPQVLYNLPIHNKLLVDPTLKLIVTNVPDENDVDLNQNSVMSIESISYQVCFKVSHADTKDNKVVVFNPQVPSFSSLSIIEVPPEYKVLDIGPLHVVTKDRRRTSLAILAAKVNALDEEFMAKENDMYIFLVTDMTPTLQFKPYKNTSCLTQPIPKEYGDGTISAVNSKQIYNFNVTSNIFSAEKIEENKQKTEANKMLIDSVRKRLQASYEIWGNHYDAGALNNTNMSKTIDIKVLSSDYSDHEDIKNTELKDLREFFVRLDPLAHIYGHVFNYSGRAESSIEDFMGIVKVLSPNDTKKIEIDDGITKELKQITEKQLGKISLDCSCPIEPYGSVKTYLEPGTVSLKSVRRCSPVKGLHVITTWENSIYKIKQNELQSHKNRFDDQFKNYFLFDQFIFYVYRKDRTLTVCRQQAGQLDLESGSVDFKACNSDRRASVQLDYGLGLNSTSLTFDLVPLESTDRYLLTIMHFNRAMSIYTMVEFFDMHFPKFNSINSFPDQSGFIHTIGHVYVGSNNLKLAYAAILTPFKDEDSLLKSLNIENKAKFDAKDLGSLTQYMRVNLNVALVYYRWRQNTELTLMQDVVDITYTKFYGTEAAAMKSTAVPGLYEDNAINALYSTSIQDVQGFTVAPKAKGVLMKFATLLFSMKNPNNIMRSVVEHIQIWTPQKMIKNAYTDTFKNFSKDGKDYSSPIFKIIIDFSNSNAYLLHSSLNFLKYAFTSLDAEFGPNEILGGRRVGLSYFKIAPIENPFIGFLPDNDNPDPILIDDYLFVARNYQDKSYFYFYTLEHEKLVHWEDLKEPTKDAAKDAAKEPPKSSKINIFGMSTTPNVANNTAATIFSSSEKNNYMRVNLLITLQDRPSTISVVPNCNLGHHLEHCLYYLSSDEKLININFTSYMNIRIKTHKIASRQIFMNSTGKFGRNISLKINVGGDPNASMWTSTKNVTLILILLGISIVLAIGTMIVIEKDVKITLAENNQVLSRHSVLPITNVILNYFQNTVMPPDKTKNKEEEELSVSSDESNDSADDLKKNLVSSKKEPDTAAFLHRPLEPVPQDSKELRSGQNFIVDPVNDNEAEDFANPLK